MKYKWLKKEQKKFSASIKALNKNIYDDSLWKGRFTCRQVNRNFFCYDDNSGGEITYAVALYDKQTKKKHIIYVNNYNYHYQLWREMNDFIVEYCRVWEEHPMEEKTIDWRNK